MHKTIAMTLILLLALAGAVAAKASYDGPPMRNGYDWIDASAKDKYKAAMYAVEATTKRVNPQLAGRLIQALNSFYTSQNTLSRKWSESAAMLLVILEAQQ